MKTTFQAINKTSQIVPFIKTGEYFFDKGIAAYRKKNLDKAIRHLERAVKLEPYEPVFICQLAAVLAEVGEYNKSNDLLQHIISEIDEEMYECHFFMANNYAHLGFFSEAQKQAIKYMHNELDGEFYEDAEDLLEMLIHDTEMVDVDHNEEDQLILAYEQARYFFEVGRIEEAIESLNGVIKEYPQFWPGHNLLAEAHFASGNTEEAIRLLELNLEKDNTNLIAYCNLAVFYKKVGLEHESESIVAGLKVTNPISVDHQYKIATMFGLLGEHENAYERFLSLSRRGFEGGAGYLHRFAVAAFHTGRMMKAESLWSKSSRFYDNGNLAEILLDKLKKGLLTAEEVQYTTNQPKGIES